MKILLTADWHFDCNNRLGDFVSSANHMVDYAIKNQVKNFVIVGDMYRNWRPSAERQEFHKILARLILCNIDVTLVLGNHDVNEKEQSFLQHALSEFVDVGNERIQLVYREPKMLTMGGKQVYVIPHLSKAYLTRLNPAAPVKYRDAFVEAVKQGNAASLILAHTLVMDAIDGPVDPESERGVMLSDFKSILMTNMFLGDIHGHRILNQSPLVGYISSPERITFNEIDDDKGFVVFDLNTQEYEFVPLPTRRFFQINIDLNKNEFSFRGTGDSASAALGDGDRTELITSIIRATADVIKDAVVKLVVVGHKQDLNLINRHAVISRLKECLPFKIMKVSFDSTDDTVARDTQFTGHLTTPDAFKLWMTKQAYADKVMAEAVQKAGLEVLNETV